MNGRISSVCSFILKRYDSAAVASGKAVAIFHLDQCASPLSVSPTLNDLNKHGQEGKKIPSGQSLNLQWLGRGA